MRKRADGRGDRYRIATPVLLFFPLRRGRPLISLIIPKFYSQNAGVVRGIPRFFADSGGE